MIQTEEHLMKSECPRARDGVELEAGMALTSTDSRAQNRAKNRRYAKTTRQRKSAMLSSMEARMELLKKDVSYSFWTKRQKHHVALKLRQNISVIMTISQLHLPLWHKLSMEVLSITISNTNNTSLSLYFHK